MIEFKCQRIMLKQVVSVASGFFAFLILDYLTNITGASYGMNSFISMVIMFLLLAICPYLSFFNQKVKIVRDERFVIIVKDNKERRYEHNNGDELSMHDYSIFVKDVKIMLSLPCKKISFILSRDEGDIDGLVDAWKSLKR